MAVQTLDMRGLRCPQPTLKITAQIVRMKIGDILEAIADCPTFEKDVRDWCLRSKKILLWLRDEDGAKRCQIRI